MLQCNMLHRNKPCCTATKYAATSPAAVAAGARAAGARAAGARAAVAAGARAAVAAGARAAVAATSIGQKKPLTVSGFFWFIGGLHIIVPATPGP